MRYIARHRLSEMAVTMLVTSPMLRSSLTLRPSTMPSPCKVRCCIDGGRNLRRAKAAARANRIETLRTTATREFEKKELAGLLSRGDPWDPSHFTESHSSFKAAQNEQFVRLALHCANETARRPNVFYLDGREGGSTCALLSAGFVVQQLYVANNFDHVCMALKAAPHHLVPNQVLTSSAEDALSGDSPFASIPFTAFYLDGCSGLAAPLVRTVEAVFAPSRASIHPQCFAIGFTLTEAEPSGRSIVDREQDVHRAIASACRRSGFSMSHVGDEPLHYGVRPDILKKEGGTLTTWVVCTRRVRLPDG